MLNEAYNELFEYDIQSMVERAGRIHYLLLDCGRESFAEIMDEFFGEERNPSHNQLKYALDAIMFIARVRPSKVELLASLVFHLQNHVDDGDKYVKHFFMDALSRYEGKYYPHMIYWLIKTGVIRVPDVMNTLKANSAKLGDIATENFLIQCHWFRQFINPSQKECIPVISAIKLAKKSDAYHRLKNSLRCSPEQPYLPDTLEHIIYNDDDDSLARFDQTLLIDAVLTPTVFDTIINADFVTPVEFAAFHGSIKCFKLLNNVAPEPLNMEKKLVAAVAGGNLEIIRHLYDAYRTIRDEPDFTCIAVAAASYFQMTVMTWLFESHHEMDINARYEGETVLGNAAVVGNTEMVIYAMEKGADINIKIDNKTPIALAVENGHDDLAIILSHAKNIDFWSRNEVLFLFYTVLHIAARYRCIQLIDSLLSMRRIPVNSVNSQLVCFLFIKRLFTLPREIASLMLFSYCVLLQEWT